jgi:hypothetical protein
VSATSNEDYQSKRVGSFALILMAIWQIKKPLSRKIAMADLQRHRQMYQFMCRYYKLSISWINMERSWWGRKRERKVSDATQGKKMKHQRMRMK